MIVRGKSGRATGAPYKPNLTEPDSHEQRFSVVVRARRARFRATGVGALLLILARTAIGALRRCGFAIARSSSLAARRLRGRAAVAHFGGLAIPWR